MTTRYTVGRVRPPGTPADDLGPGEFAWDGRRVPPCWVACCPEPGGDLACLDVHTVEVEPSGMISVREEVRFPRGWHGFLQGGVWRELWP